MNSDTKFTTSRVSHIQWTGSYDQSGQIGLTRLTGNRTS